MGEHYPAEPEDTDAEKYGKELVELRRDIDAVHADRDTSDAVRKRLMAKYLDVMYNLYKRYMAAHSRYTDSITKFSQDYLGIPINSFSPWTQQVRLPSKDFADQLVEGLTRDVYYICGYPPRSPNDPDYNIVERNWGYMPPTVRNKIRDIIQIERAKQKEAKDKKENPKNTAGLPLLEKAE